MNQQEQEQEQEQEQKVTTFPQALQMLVDGVQVAQKRGAYKLEESSMLYQAMNFLRSTSQQQQTQQTQQQKKPLERVEEL